MSEITDSAKAISDFATQLIQAVVPQELVVTDLWGDQHTLKLKVSAVTQTRAIRKAEQFVNSNPLVATAVLKVQEANTLSRADTASALFTSLINLAGEPPVLVFLGELFTLVHPQVAEAIRARHPEAFESTEAREFGVIPVAFTLEDIIGGLAPFVQMSLKRLLEAIGIGRPAKN